LHTGTNQDFWSFLESQNYSLLVTREYEHFAPVVDGTPQGAWQSPFPLPHPSGVTYDSRNGDVILSSTRTPNILIWMRQIESCDYDREIIPDHFAPPEGCVFVPYKAVYLQRAISLASHSKMPLWNDSTERSDMCG